MLFTISILAALAYGGNGVTKQSGIEQFWTDDYKIFDNVYGKTSDKEIYGVSLPPSVRDEGPSATEATEKKEKYLQTLDQDADPSDKLNFAENYKLIKQAFENAPKKPKQATSTTNFVSYSNFQPITQSNAPETYDYLQHLEEYTKKENFEFPKTVGGFKPYSNYVGSDPEDSEAYKGIQRILKAHEANKGSYKGIDDIDNVKITHSKSKRKKPRVEVQKPKCSGGRCRKRATPALRGRVRPYLRVKHRVVRY